MPELKVVFLTDKAGLQSDVGAVGSAVNGLEAVVTAKFTSMTANVAAFSLAFNQIEQLANRVVNAVSRPFTVFSSFQTDVQNVASLGVQNLSVLRGGILEVSRDVSVPLDDISKGLYEVVSAGVDAANQISVLEASAVSAKAGIAQTNESLRLGGAVIKGYGKDWSEFENILDQGLQTVKDGQTTFGELAGSIGGVVPGFAALKIETRELFGGFATLTGVTGSTAEVSTQLEGISRELSKPTAELAALVREHANASVENVVAQRGLAGILEIVQRATGGSASRMNELFSSSEAVTAMLALTGAQYETFIEKSQRMEQSQGAMRTAFEEQNKTLASQLQILENRFNARMIEAVELVEPFVSDIITLGAELLNVNWQPFIIGAGVASAAIVGLNIGTAITALGGFSSALGIAGTALTAFSTTAKLAIASIPVAGWVTAGIAALSTLSVALIATADDERDLAIQRRTVAEETLSIIEAEIARVEQAVKTQGATQGLTEQLENMNQHLINQKKIIADANIEIFTNDLQEASKAVERLAGNIEVHTADGAFFGMPAGLNATSDQMRALLFQFGDDFIAMDEQVTARIVDINDELRKNTAGAISLSAERVENLQAERDRLNEVNEVVSEAAKQQRLLNAELERLKNLGDIEQTTKQTTISENIIINKYVDKFEKPDKPDALEEREQERRINVSTNIDEELPEDLPFFDDDRLMNQLDRQLEIVDLNYQRELLSYEEFQEEKIRLFSEAEQKVAEGLGENNILYMRLNAEKVQNERELQEKRKLISQTAQLTIQGHMRTLFQDFQGVNREMFSIAKGLSIAQATIDTYKAANTALAQYGWPIGGVIAGLITAKGLANVARIARTKFQKFLEGGPIGKEFRTVSSGDFGEGENRLIIANDREFIVRGEQTYKNLSVLQAINDSSERFRLLDGNTLVAESQLQRLPLRVNGGLSSVNNESLSRLNQSTASLSTIVNRQEFIQAPIDNSAVVTQFNDLRQQVVDAIGKIQINFKNTLDGQTFIVENLEGAEKLLRQRRAV